MERMDSPYENFLQMNILEKGEGSCKIVLFYRKEVTNPHGNFHGGVIASVVDTAAVQALRTLSLPGPYLTVNLDIRYKNPSMASKIFAEAYTRHLKGKLFLTEVKVVDSDDKFVAQASVKSFLPKWTEDKT